MTRRNTRGAVALAAALLAFTLGAQPALGAEVIKVTGTLGGWGVSDDHSKPGAMCLYDSANLLDKIRVRAPIAYGDYIYFTWAGWRFKILRLPSVGGSYQTIYTSAVQKDNVNAYIDADDFTDGAWNVPAAPNGTYKVRIVILYYRQGSKTKVDGKVVVEYDYYRVQADRLVPYVRQNNCLDHL